MVDSSTPMDDFTSADPRRAAPRVPLNANVEVLAPTPASGIVLNVSTGGLRVAVDQALYIEDYCHLRIVTDDEEGCVERARVRWVKAKPDGWIVGLELDKAG